MNFFVIGVNVRNESFNSSFLFVIARELAKEVGGHLLVGVDGVVGVVGSSVSAHIW